MQNAINSSEQVPIINTGNLEPRLQSLAFLLSWNTSVLIFPRSQPVKTLHIFSAPIQRNLSFTPYFVPYVGSWRNEGFSCQSPKAAQAPVQLHRAQRMTFHFSFCQHYLQRITGALLKISLIGSSYALDKVLINLAFKVLRSWVVKPLSERARLQHGMDVPAVFPSQQRESSKKKPVKLFQLFVCFRNAGFP